MASKDLKLSDLTAGLQKLKTVIRKRIGIMFAILVLGALVYSVGAVNFILTKESDMEYRLQKESEATSTQFDRATIEQIEALGDRQNPPEPTLPGGRINPFSE